MAQNDKVNPGVVPLKFGWKKNRGYKPELLPVRDRIPASKVREAVSTEKDSKNLYACICFPINIVLWLGGLTYIALMEAIYFALRIPSQRYWLLPAVSSLLTLFFVFYVLLYVFARPRATIPCPEVGAAAANAVTPRLSSPRPSPLLPTSVAAVTAV